MMIRTLKYKAGQKLSSRTSGGKGDRTKTSHGKGKFFLINYCNIKYMVMDDRDTRGIDIAL